MLQSDIPSIFENDEWSMAILRAIRSLNLLDWWVGAGFVRNKIWDTLHGWSRRPPGDIDVIYFNPHIYQKDREYEALLESTFPTGLWSVTNQAHIHTSNGDPPYSSSIDAISHWPETATSIAVTLDSSSHVAFHACYGTEDLLNMIVRPTPFIGKDVFYGRIEKKQWFSKWPKARLNLLT
jgi:hypothetical protein